MLLFRRRSFSVMLSASSDFLCAIVHSSQRMSLHCINNFPIALDREILHVGVSIVFNLSGNLSAECAVRPPSRRVAAIPDDANAKAMSHLDRIVAKINEMTNVFPVPPGASRIDNQYYCPPLALMFRILVFAVHSATPHYFERIPAMYQHCIAALDLILG